jgi:hypothetical protein
MYENCCVVCDRPSETDVCRNCISPTCEWCGQPNELPEREMLLGRRPRCQPCVEAELRRDYDESLWI